MELKFDDEVFRVYAISIGVLMAKFCLMSFLTARQRFANLVRIRIIEKQSIKIKSESGTT